jgi:hypothetical protein
LFDAVGLIIHPVDFSVAGDSYKVKSASKSSAVSAPDRFSTGKGARLSGIREQNQRVVGGMVALSEISHALEHSPQALHLLKRAVLPGSGIGQLPV